MVDSKIRKQLIDLISQYFDATGLQRLYISVGLDYDSLSSGGVLDRTLELVQYLARQSRLPELLAELQTVRPNLAWPDLTTVASFTNRLHQIPYPENPNFTGRTEILQQVAATLNARQTTVVTQAIVGLGGVGKTQLALAYCYAHLDAYDLIYWLSADNQPTLGESMMLLAHRLKLVPPNQADQDVARQAVLRFLSQSQQRWLLVYDNADLIAPKQLAATLPRSGHGHVLITSRNPNWGGLGQVLELGLFTLDEAVEFLLQRRGTAIGQVGAQKEKSPEWKEAAALAEALGRLPLALEHAAAYVEIKGSSYAAYHRLFANHQAELWRRAEKPERYHATITTTWELAFDQMKQTPRALDLLNLCCFLDPESIPLELIKQLSTIETPLGRLREVPLQEVVANELELDDMIGILRRYSLIQRTADELSMHRLVQAVARSQMGETRARGWVEVAVDLLSQAFRYDPHDMATWIACSDLLPHLITATELAEQYGDARSITAYLNNGIGDYVKSRGNFTAALPYYERALSIREQRLDPDHPDTAQSLNNLGALLLAMGDLIGAQSYIKRALAINEKVFGSDHPNNAESLNSLGSILQEMGDLAEARPYYERTLVIREKVLGSDHPDTAQSLNNLGSLLLAMGNLAEAQPYYERALTIREKVLGPDHPETGMSCNNLGFLLRIMGNLAEARPNVERGLAIQEKTLGLDHPDLAYSLNNLGQLVEAQGDLPLAHRYLSRALAIFEKALGPEHVNTAAILNHLGRLLLNMGDLAAARLNFERALAIQEKVLNSDHIHIGQSLKNLGQLAEAEGDLPLARHYLMRALSIFEKTLGPEHKNSKRVHNTLTALEAKMQT